jgi:hypothetical protein
MKKFIQVYGGLFKIKFAFLFFYFFLFINYFSKEGNFLIIYFFYFLFK